MKSYDWAKASPFVLFAVSILVVTLMRGLQNPEYFLDSIVRVGVPTLIVIVAAIWGVGRYRRAKAQQIWEVMEKYRPDDARYLVAVYPRTLKDFAYLGWRPKPQVPGVIPIVGVAFGANITFWAAEQESHALSLEFGHIENIEPSRVEDGGVRNFPALRFLLVDSRSPGERGRRRSELLLSLQEIDQMTVSEVDQAQLARDLTTKLSPT